VRRGQHESRRLSRINESKAGKTILLKTKAKTYGIAKVNLCPANRKGFLAYLLRRMRAHHRARQPAAQRTKILS
jgi:hypothetical protein